MTTEQLKTLRIGDKVRTWCAGREVTGKVTEIKHDGFIVSHKPVRYGNHNFKKTYVHESTPLQKMFYSDTTPYSEKL